MELKKFGEILRNQIQQEKLNSNVVCGFERNVLEQLVATYIRKNSQNSNEAFVQSNVPKLIERLVFDMDKGNTKVKSRMRNFRAVIIESKFVFRRCVFVCVCVQFYEELLALDQHQHNEQTYQRGRQKMAEEVLQEQLRQEQKHQLLLQQQMELAQSQSQQQQELLAQPDPARQPPPPADDELAAEIIDLTPEE